jgi:hypothetical protein
MITRNELLKSAPLGVGSILLLSPVAAQAKGARRELRRWLKQQHAALQANERRTLRLRNRQEAVVRKTHRVITNRLSDVKSSLSSDREKDAVDVAAKALHDQAKAVHVETQQVMTEQLQMIRRQITQAERMIAEL